MQRLFIVAKCSHTKLSEKAIMDEENFNKLAGHAEAATFVLTRLIAALEVNGALDGDKFTGQLLHDLDQWNRQAEWVPQAKRVVTAMVLDLNEARKARHKH